MFVCTHNRNVCDTYVCVALTTIVTLLAMCTSINNIIKFLVSGMQTNDRTNLSQGENDAT